VLACGFVLAFLASLMLIKGNIPSLKLASARALAMAESAAEVGMRALRDDRTAAPQSADPSANGYCLSPAVDSTARVSAVGGSGDPERIKTCEGTDAGAYMLRKNGESVEACGWDDAVNYIGMRLEDAAVECVLRRVTGELTHPLLTCEYSTDGGRSWKNAGEQAVTGDAYMAVRMKIALPAGWKGIVGRGAGGLKVRLRNSGEAGGVAVDYLCLRLTVRVDAETAPWKTRSYITLPARVSPGAIREIGVEDESGKVNINTASQPLIQSLMEEYGVAPDAAAAAASALVNGRTSHTFRAVEEAMASPGMTPEIYGARTADPALGTRRLSDDLTVFSWINRLGGRSGGMQAPVNINTASGPVLRAVFGPLALDKGDAAALAHDIIDRRKTQPFGCLFTSNPACGPYSFYAFLKGRTYLTDQEVNALMANADLSPRRWTNNDTVTAGFSFSTNSWMITGAGAAACPDAVVERSVRVVYGDVYDYETLGFSKDASLRLPVTVNDRELFGYWKEQ
jgi:hypothetical protein